MRKHRRVEMLSGGCDGKELCQKFCIETSPRKGKHLALKMKKERRLVRECRFWSGCSISNGIGSQLSWLRAGWQMSFILVSSSPFAIAALFNLNTNYVSSSIPFHGTRNNRKSLLDLQYHSLSCLLHTHRSPVLYPSRLIQAIFPRSFRVPLHSSERH